MPETRRRFNPRAIAILAGVAVVVILIDQLSKWAVVTHLSFDHQVNVLGPLLQFRYVRNSGAAFSLGSSMTWVFTIIALTALGFVVWYAPRIRSLVWACMFGFLLGGLVGNLIDRLFRQPSFGQGEVVDFLKIPLLPAIFNLADTSIVTAMVLFLIVTIRGIGLDGVRATDREPVGDALPERARELGISEEQLRDDYAGRTEGVNVFDDAPTSGGTRDSEDVPGAGDTPRTGEAPGAQDSETVPGSGSESRNDAATGTDFSSGDSSGSVHPPSEGHGIA